MSIEISDPQMGLTAAEQGARSGGHANTRAQAGFGVAQDVRLLLIAVWLGAAVFFSFAVAPSAFAVLPARELAGNLVTRTLGIVNVAGVVISLLLLASSFIGRELSGRRAWLLEVCALALVALSTFIGHWLINARLLALRHAMGRPIDEVAAGDPVRVAFDNLHGYSVVALSIGMLAGIVALLVMARRRGR